MIHESLSHVIHGHAGLLGDLPQVKNALVSDVSVLSFVQDGIVSFQFFSNVVSGENRYVSRVS